ncbi:hypothetical protein CEP52_002360 [Fusarium oligoseptatum]|uniref:Uncharacterized protein n=1 Tax=Fusarium oligoseptatum TaxID=2604345 RepID=A0A428UDZ9_9HYPO|nr:hypothetical protein CEP52_002360 [Fusarium oligoseptatum]
MVSINICRILGEACKRSSMPAKKARENNLDYLWVDTCCIDKSSSAELSEAINSMFKWYMESANCYVFMDDVTLQEDGFMDNFANSRWFTRGWTLQELIAPHGLFFFDQDWNYMCSRDQIASRLEEITGITETILRRAHTFPRLKTPLLGGRKPLCPGCGHLDEVKRELAEEPISRKMTWAADRRTTRPEDASYSLMGLFDINMPLLYGEGENAFRRLQEEILQKSPDQSILTWTEPIGEDQDLFHKPYLPKGPSSFRFAVRRPVPNLLERGDIITTTRGLEIDVLLGPCAIRYKHTSSPTLDKEHFMAVLSCAVDRNPLPRVAILVEPFTPGDPDTAYTRVRNRLLIQLHPNGRPSIWATGVQGVEFKNAFLDYDPRKLSPRRILLAAIRPMRYHLKQRLIVSVVAPEISMAHAETKHWTPSHDTKILYKARRGVGTLSLGGASYVGNGHSGFFVLWGVPENPDHGDFVSWLETWGSFLRGNHSEASPSSLEWHTFRKALEQYMRVQTADLSAKISEIGLKVKVNVQATEFLGRTTYRLMLDIQGWRDSPVSVVKCLKVVDSDWT